MLLKFSRFSLYASLFSILIVLPSTFFPFIGGKYYFFRAAVELALIFFILWWGFESSRGETLALFTRIAGKPLFIAISFFVLVYLLSAIFAHNPNGAFWSNYERGDGAFQMLHYYAFFILLTLFAKSRAEWRLIFKIFILAAVGMILYGVFSQLGWVSFFVGPVTNPGSATWWQKLTEPRFQGSLGNPAYVAPYLMFAIFYALYLWAESRTHSAKNKNVINGLAYWALAAFFFFFFVLSQTRGAFLGLAAGLIAFFIFLFFLWRTGRKWILGILIFLILFGGTLAYFRHSPAVKAIPGARFFELVDLGFEDRTVQTRFWTWNSAWQGFKERPILGWGPENFSTVFDKYFDPRHFIPGTNAETWFDRAHSVIFDYLAETGAVGLLSYLSIFAVFYYEFFKNLKRQKTSTDAQEADNFPAHFKSALIFAMPIGYFVQGLALFDVLPIYINLFLFFAFAFFKYHSGEKNIIQSNK